MSGFEKRDHFALKFNFELVVLNHSTGDGLFVALQQLLPFPSYARSKYENTLGAITRKRLVSNPSVFISVNMASA